MDAVIIVFGVIGGLLLITLPIFLSTFLTNRKFKKSEYCQATHNGYFSTFFNKGRLGEYLIYDVLKNIEGDRRFFFNAYIPKDDGGTTEADVIMLHPTGIYVFESKNYSGYIYGSQGSEYWNQSIFVRNKNGRIVKRVANRFYNPIRQNSGRIKALKRLVNEPGIPYYSIVVFSNRSTLMKITLKNDEHKVVRRKDLPSCVRSIISQSKEIISPAKMEAIASLISPCTNVSKEVREQHDRSVREQHK